MLIIFLLYFGQINYSKEETIRLISVGCHHSVLSIALNKVTSIYYDLLTEKSNQCSLKLIFPTEPLFFYLSMKLCKFEVIQRKEKLSTISYLKIIQDQVILNFNTTTQIGLQPLLLDPIIHDKVNYSLPMSIMLSQIGNDQTVLNMLLTVIYKCQEENYFTDTLFKCSSEACVDKFLFCDGYPNCPQSNIDEVAGICYKSNVTALILPIILTTTLVFILIWLVYKLGPCFLSRYANRDRFLSQLHIFQSPRNIQLVPVYSMDQDSNPSTPANLPIAPPIYNRDVNVESAKAALPPSYTNYYDDTPDFFRKFFGKAKYQENSTGKSCISDFN